MKSFREFILEAKDAVKDATYTGDAAEQERIRQRELKRGFDPDKERSEARRKAKEELLRNRTKTAKVPTSTFTNNSPTKGTPTPSKQPSGSPQQTQTPAKGAQTPPPSSNPPKSSAPPKAGPLSQIPKSSPTPPKPSAVKPNALKGLKGGSVLSGVIDTAAEKSSGSGWARSLAKGTASALGALGGGALGSAAGPIGTFAGGAAGSMAAGKAFDTVAGKNAVQRAADREANRKRQSGGELKGIGGKTTFSKAKDGTGFMSTGSGSQRKTVQLAKTSVVKDPKTGKAETGYLAMKDGKAIYKRGANPGEGSSNAFERIGRTFNPNAYKANDAKLAAAKLKTAATSDIKRQQALGVKGSQNLVGPKIVGPQKPTPKPSAGIRSSGTSPGSIKIK